jgi:polygalacturonase
MKKVLLPALLLLGVFPPAFASSVFNSRLDDPKAVYVTAQEFGSHGDGKADDSAAIQAAVDKAGSNAHEGIVFVPPGRYRLTRTVYIWPGSV